MEFRFVIRDDINVRARSLIDLKYKDYKKEDIARAVAFFIDLISNIQDKKIAIGFGNISLLSMAFLLALHKSKREYILIYHNGHFNFDEHSGLYSHMFFTGATNEFQKFELKKFKEKNPNKITFTDTQLIERSAFSYHKNDNLKFDYTGNRKVEVVLNNKLELVYNSDEIEGSSIATAIDNYFHEDDYVVIMRPLQHFGVGTLSIFPAFFKVKNISLCPFLEDWQAEYHKATHIHIDIHMMNIGCNLPSKLRMLTSGGYNFNSECIEYVTSRSEIENIVDCFGTIFCPPPLAIRRLNAGETKFTWVNKFIKPTLVNNKLAFTTINGDIFEGISTARNGKIVTSDIVTLDGDNFYFGGNVNKFIRMTHIRYPVIEFERFFKDKTGISDAEVIFEKIDGLDNPVIIVNSGDFYEASKLIAEFHIEAKLKSR